MAQVDIEINYEDEITLPKCCWKFNSSYNRFIALIYICSYGFLISITYDMPASLEYQIESTFSIKPYQFEYMYSFYSFPNIVLCFFGGVLIDKILGPKWATLLMAGCSLAGQIIITIGAFVDTYWIVLAGRVVYGFGGEALGVAAIYYSMIWFAGKELNFVSGLLGSISRLGTSFDFLIAYPLYKFAEKNSPKAPLAATVSMGIPIMVLVICFLLLLARESKRNNKIGKNAIKGTDECDTIKFRDILRFSGKFWLVIAVQITFVVAVYVFVSCSQELLMNKYNYSEEKANQIGSLFNIIGALSSPLPGIIIDKLGRELYFTIGGFVLAIGSQIILAFTQWNPLVPIMMFAIAFSTLSSCTGPLITFVVEQYQMGTAIGTMQSIANLSLTVSTIFAGYLLGKFGYLSACLFYMAYLLIGLICCCTLWIIDIKENGVLNVPASLKHLRQK